MGFEKIIYAYEAFIRLPRTQFLAISTTALLSVAVILAFIFRDVSTPSSAKYALGNIGALRFAFVFFAVVVMGPLVETLVFQVIPYKIFKMLGVNSLILCSIVISVLFLISHTGGRNKLVQIGIVGFLYYFLYAERARAGASSPFLDIAMLHGIRNSFAMAVLAFYEID